MCKKDRSVTVEEPLAAFHWPDRGHAAVAAKALPGQWNAASGTYTVTDVSRAAMQTFFNVSPTEAQASSFSEP